MPGRILARAVPVFGKDEDVGLRLVGRQRQPFARMPLRPRERVAAVAPELRRGETVEIIQQDVVSVVELVGGVAVNDLAGSKARTGIVRLAVAPVEDATIKVRHRPFVGFTDEDLRVLRGKQAAGPGRVRRVRDDAANARNRVVELLLRYGVIAAPQGRRRDPIIEEHPIALHRGRGLPIRDRAAARTMLGQLRDAPAPKQSGSRETENRQRTNRRKSRPAMSGMASGSHRSAESGTSLPTRGQQFEVASRVWRPVPPLSGKPRPPDPAS